MEWIQATIYTTTQAVDIVSGALLQVGINGFAIEDANDFKEFLTDTTINWDYVDEDLMRLEHCETNVKFYLTKNPQGSDMLSDVKSKLLSLKDLSPDLDFGRLELELDSIHEEDWANAWKEYYHPTKVGEKLVICPSWEDYKASDGETKIVLNPGMAFGTGQHNTTRLCMELLEKYVSDGIKVFDVGCGSGILAVTAVLLGAKSAIGIDIDELAAKIGAENAALNNVSDQVQFYCGDLSSTRDQTKGKYEIICMNIVADVIISLWCGIKPYMSENGRLLLSGIIDEREQDVIDALCQNGLSIESRLIDGGWVALECKLMDKLH
ncbi:MAG: ribosomal protein methyltransferase [Oscillospiraceae bacterium]|nr:ribosomal protein methyltransferase [Oscillospiraceae bacterium]